MASLSELYTQEEHIPQDETYVEDNTEGFKDDASNNSSDGYYGDDIDYDEHSRNDHIARERSPLIREKFIEIIGAGFKPGITRLSDSEVIWSVSYPIPNLSIPPRALMAWDRRLLQSYNNLTLLISGMNSLSPALFHDGSIAQDVRLKYHVGLCAQYKPSRESVLQKIRKFNINSFTESEFIAGDDVAVSYGEGTAEKKNKTYVLPPRDTGCFESFSLSSSLESVLENLISVLQLRLKFHLGWAGAETLHALSTQVQKKPEDLLVGHRLEVAAADHEETQLKHSYSLPQDPLEKHTDGQLNLPLIAYYYLIRRLMLCPRYCLVCHRKIATKFEALKPYVCDNKLCTYQYFALNIGPSIEYEIRTNPTVVDLLVSLTYVSAYEGQLSEEDMPTGLGLRVPPPKLLSISNPLTGIDGMVDFDALNLPSMQAAIVEMFNRLPPIRLMKDRLEHGISGKASPQLRSIDGSIPAAAWVILRWCVASSTAYLEEIEDPNELVCNISSNWRQFRFSVGAPDKEARALTAVQKTDANARDFPVLYGFHGSALKNWHSIIRRGLLIKPAVNGRVYGEGVYFAKNGDVSLGYYAPVSSSRWVNSEICPVACVALAEIVNAPMKFTSNHPSFVVQHVDWVLCRYLLVNNDPRVPYVEADSRIRELQGGSYVELDPKNALTVGNKAIRIPEQSRMLHMLLAARQSEQPKDEAFDDDDVNVLTGRQD